MCLGYLLQLGERRKEQLPDPSLPTLPFSTPVTQAENSKRELKLISSTVFFYVIS